MRPSETWFINILFHILILISSAAWAQSSSPPSTAQHTQIVPTPLNLLPGSPVWLASLPKVPHEISPDMWPQPDYFTEALRKSDFQADLRFSSLKLLHKSDATNYVVLPVQTQAFGFAPAFRALVGAELDNLLASSNIFFNEPNRYHGCKQPFCSAFRRKNCV